MGKLTHIKLVGGIVFGAVIKLIPRVYYNYNFDEVIKKERFIFMRPPYNKKIRLFLAFVVVFAKFILLSYFSKYHFDIRSDSTLVVA